ncbi:caspase family protein [Sulfurimonas sp.]|nr:caspase family protein [Sulfurimonas sp.]
MLKNLLLLALLTTSLFSYEIIINKTNNDKSKAQELINSCENFWADSKYNHTESKHIYNEYDAKNEIMQSFSSDVLSRIMKKKCTQENVNLNSIVSIIIEEYLKSIPKPPKELKLEKDEFETTAEFNARVEKTKKEQSSIVTKYQKDYSKETLKAKKRAMKKALEMTWGKPTLTNLKYDADNGYFVADINFEAKKDFSKKVAIKVSRKEARSFKQKFDTLKPQAIFDYDGKSVKLKDIRVPYKKKNYMAQFTDLSIDDTRVAVNLKNDLHVDTNINTNITVVQSEVSTFDASNLTNFSELDKLLSKAKQVKTDRKKWLFVVGVEKYQYTDNISYAKRSAEMFVKTAQKRLGVTKSNSYVMINEKASQATIKTSMKKLLRRVKKGDTIYFYYNGHGVPVPSLKNAPFMLTADTEPDFVADEKFFSLQNIYSKLSGSKASKIVAVVDSCFSGVTDGKAVLKGVAATKMVAKSVKFDKQKMVVLTAGKGNQYSNGYDKKGHRLFSFFVMKNIIEGKSDIKTLYKETKSQTYDTSIEEYGDSRTQEPTVDGNLKLRL